MTRPNSHTQTIVPALHPYQTYDTKKLFESSPAFDPFRGRKYSFHEVHPTTRAPLGTV